MKKNLSIAVLFIMLFSFGACTSGAVNREEDESNVSTNVADGAVDVDVNSAFTLSFPVSVSAASVNSDSFFVVPVPASASLASSMKKSVGSAVDSSICDPENAIAASISASTSGTCSDGYTLTPDSQLEYGTQYALCVLSSITMCNPNRDGFFTGFMKRFTTISSGASYTVGGTLAGLAPSSEVVLQNNAADDLPLTSNGAFTFSTGITDGAAYEVTVKTHPAGYDCTVSNGSGNISGADVTNVSVTCAQISYNVGGTLAGLGSEPITLEINGGDPLYLDSDGGFTFSQKLADGSAYEVELSIAACFQGCTIANASGTITGDVSNVNVTCTDKSFQTIGLDDSFSANIPDQPLFATKANSSPSVGYFDDGGLLLSWVAVGPSVMSVYPAIYDGSEWQYPNYADGFISADDKDVRAMDMAVNSSGDAVISWRDEDDKIFSRIYSGGVWGDIVLNSPVETNASYGPVVAMNDSGQVVVAWRQQKEFGVNQIYASVYDPDDSTGEPQGWHNPATSADAISDSLADAEIQPFVVLNNQGLSMVLWNQVTDGLDATERKIFAASYDFNSPGPIERVLVSITEDVQAEYVSAAIDDGGRIIAVWQEYEDGPVNKLWWNSYSDSSWGVPAQIDFGGTGSNEMMKTYGYNSLIKISPSGEYGVLTWKYDSPGGDSFLCIGYMTDGGTWNLPSNLDECDYANGIERITPYIDVAANDAGLMLVSWWGDFESAAMGPMYLFVNQFKFDEWINPSSNDDAKGPVGPEAPAPIKTNDMCDAIITWSQPNGEGPGFFQQVYKSEFQ